jgi:hypothetical protein
VNWCGVDGKLTGCQKYTKCDGNSGGLQEDERHVKGRRNGGGDTIKNVTRHSGVATQDLQNTTTDSSTV